MTIQRQYSLPNCTLVLEGLSTHTAQVERPLLDVLIRFECQLTGSQKSLTGGRDLLENLAAAASQFAQEYLSGVRRTGGNSKGHSPVQLETVDPHSCRLLVQPELLVGESAIAAPNSSSQPARPVEIGLSTVQVFDLVEAFDQFFADTQTLPDLSLDFRPISKRESTSRQPVTERAAPVALGVTSLALATVALFLIPIPKVEKRPTPERTPSQPEQNQPPVPNGSPDPRQSSSGAATSTLAIAPHQLSELQQKLYTLIDQAWKTRPTFARDVVYRVGTDQNAKITGYWFENQAAIDYAGEVPLLDLLKVPLPGQSAQQPSAQFQVVFTSMGALQVSPWSNLGSPLQKISGKAALR